MRPCAANAGCFDAGPQTRNPETTVKIAHVITRLLRAGSEENTLITSAGQLREGHEVYILHGRDANLDFARKMAPGIELVEIPALERELSPRNDYLAYRQLRASLREIRPAIVHTHQSKAGIVGRLAARAEKVPGIVHGVHILPFLEETGVKKAIYLGAERHTARMTDAFIHVADNMRDACIEHDVGRDKPHHIVYSGFDLARFAHATECADWREMLGVPSGPKPPVVAMLASLEDRKQHLKLIEHFSIVLKRVPDANLVLAGEGELRQRIEARIAELGLQSRVHLLGYRRDPERVIALADLCLLCSLREGLPRSVLQYLAVGRPAVVFDVVGIDRLVADGKSGLIVPQGEWERLMTGVADLLLDGPRREAMARAAKATDLSPWDAALMATKTLAVYDEALGARQRVMA
jgi:glycosyltransferase involved in cell wall biosynthesis